jgi:hypothetical protein
MFSIASPRPRADPRRVALIKEWVLASLPAAVDDATVIVNQVQCFQPDCPPLDTLIAVLWNEITWKMQVQKPVNEITREEVGIAVATFPVDGNQAEQPADSNAWPEASWRAANKDADASNSAVQHAEQVQDDESQLVGEDGWPLPEWRVKELREQQKKGKKPLSLKLQAPKPAVHWLHDGLQGCPCCAPLI